MVEAKTRDAAEKAVELMKTAFARVFSKDSQVTEDVESHGRRRRREQAGAAEAVRVLGLSRCPGSVSPDRVRDSRVPSDAEARARRRDAIDAALSTFVQEPEDDDLPNPDEDVTKPPRPELPTEWVGEDENAVMLTRRSAAARGASLTDTAHAVSQAPPRGGCGAGRRPRGSRVDDRRAAHHRFDEAMWLLRELHHCPFWSQAGLFLRAMYNNMARRPCAWGWCRG